MVGAVAVCLSNDQGPQQLFRTESQKLQEARYLFIESTDTVRNLDPSIIDREKLIGIVSSDASEEDLPLDKMVTFERVLTLGNNAWRELRGELEDRKKLPQPEDVCTCDIDANGNLSPVDYATWFRECESVVNQLKEDQISVAYSRGVQHTIDQRLHAFFAPLAHHIPAHFSFGEISLPFESEKGMDVAFVLDPETVNELYGLVSDDGKGNSNLDNKKFAQAYDLAQVIRECESNGKKVPAKHRIKSSMMQSTFYKSLRKKIGKNVTTIWYGPGDISDYVLYLIEDAGYKIHRIKDPRQAAVEATN